MHLLLLWVAMTYNVENFFWPSKEQWEKCEKIGAIIAGNINKEAPTLVGLQEIGSDSALYMLTRWELRTLKYDYIRHPSQDPRGIAVALLYRTEQFCPLQDSTVGEDLTNRPMLYVKGLLNGDTTHVLVCHLPSQLGGRQNALKRHLLLQRAACVCQQIQQQEQHPRILMMGDMNEELSASVGPLKPLLTGGSYYSQRRWEQIDQILISEALRQDFIDSWMKRDSFLLEQNPRGIWIPSRFWLGTHCHHGYSDHLPGFAEFK